jgi:hypothetical protein
VDCRTAREFSFPILGLCFLMLFAAGYTADASVIVQASTRSLDAYGDVFGQGTVWDPSDSSAPPVEFGPHSDSWSASDAAGLPAGAWASSVSDGRAVSEPGLFMAISNGSATLDSYIGGDLIRATGSANVEDVESCGSTGWMSSTAVANAFGHSLFDVIFELTAPREIEFEGSLDGYGAMVAFHGAGLSFDSGSFLVNTVLGPGLYELRAEAMSSSYPPLWGGYPASFDCTLQFQPVPEPCTVLLLGLGLGGLAAFRKLRAA